MTKSYSNEHCQVNLILGDSMEALKGMEENQYDLAIVDPPTGQKEHGGKDRRGKSKHTKKNWDTEIPSAEYFQELFRVSKHQIIWQAIFYQNYLSSSRGWIIWDKKLYNSDFADCELAWTSFDRGTKIFQFAKNGGSRTKAALAEIIHPCQKPIELYSWTLKNYAGDCKSILDTHGGSMNVAHSCYDMGYSLDLYEVDKDYYNDGVAKFEKHIRNPLMFSPKEMYNTQLTIE